MSASSSTPTKPTSAIPDLDYLEEGDSNSSSIGSDTEETNSTEFKALLNSLETPQIQPYSSKEKDHVYEREDVSTWHFDEGDVYNEEFGNEEMILEKNQEEKQKEEEKENKEEKFLFNAFRPQKLHITPKNVNEALQMTPIPANAVYQFVNKTNDSWDSLRLLKHAVFMGGDEAVHAYSLTLLQLMRKILLNTKESNNNIDLSSKIDELYQEVMVYFSQFGISITSNDSTSYSSLSLLSSFSSNDSEAIRKNCFTAAIHICSLFCYMIIEHQPSNSMSSTEIYLVLKQVLGVEGHPHSMMVKMLGNLLNKEFRNVSRPWDSSLFKTLTSKIFANRNHQEGIDLNHPAHFLNYIRVCQKCSELTEEYVESLDLPECFADIEEFAGNTPQENVWSLFMSPNKLDRVMDQYNQSKDKYLQAYQSAQVNKSSLLAVDKSITDKAELVHYALDELAEAYDEYDVHRTREEQAIKEREEKEKRAKEKERRAEAMETSQHNEDSDQNE